MSRPHHLDPRLVALVAIGGAVGTSARYAVSTSVAASGEWPTATFTVNIAGAFLLGALLEALLRRGAESSRGRLVRLGLGTGVLGGFTTFSALALEIERLLAGGSTGTALAYTGSSLVLGFLACLLGVVVAARHHSWRHGRPVLPDAGAPTAARAGERAR